MEFSLYKSSKRISYVQYTINSIHNYSIPYSELKNEDDKIGYNKDYIREQTKITKILHLF